MSAMSVIDLQCQEAMNAAEVTLGNLGYEVGADVPTLIAIEVAEQATFMLTPVEAWECTVPYMLHWVYEQYQLIAPTLN